MVGYLALRVVGEQNPMGTLLQSPLKLRKVRNRLVANIQQASYQGNDLGRFVL
jgi:hypothetical protein